MKLKLTIIILIILLLPAIVEAFEISPYPNSLDYRDYIGENWMTSIKNQGSCGSCWAFASVGALEGSINLYYNQHLDYDLSEQQLVSNNGTCCDDCGDCDGGSIVAAINYMQNTYIIDEECFPYANDEVTCYQQCNESSSRWMVGSDETISENNDNSLFPKIKSYLNSKGSGSINVTAWSHAMVLAGYENDNLVIKNSYGTDWGDEGYVNLEYDSQHMYFDFLEDPYSLNPIINVCSDNDLDGYCYWGLSDDTSSCNDDCISESNNLLKDSDDNDSLIHNLVDVWICGNPISDYKISTDSGIYDLEVPVCFIGDPEQTIEVVVNFYVNGLLDQTQSINLENGSSEISIFAMDPNNLNLTYNDLLFEIEYLGEETLNHNDNNFLERRIWIYNYETGFIINNDNYVFDCVTDQNPEGHSIEAIVGPKTGSGILLNSVNNTEIKNCIIKGWYYGIYSSGSSDVSLINNSFNNNNNGIKIQNSSYSFISNNSLSNNNNGIYSSGSSDVSLINNSFNNNNRGIYFSSGNSTLINNTACENTTSDFICGNTNIDWDISLGNYFDNISACNDNWPIYSENYLYCDEQPTDDCDSYNTGDLNQDGVFDVLDLVQTVTLILANHEFTTSEICIVDLNNDNIIDVLDIIMMVDLILNPDNILTLNEQLSKLGITLSKEALNQAIDGNLKLYKVELENQLK